MVKGIGDKKETKSDGEIGWKKKCKARERL